MEDLIKALTIFLKYRNNVYPTHCEHDELYVVGIDKDEISRDDISILEKLSFYWDESIDSFKSRRFGSS
jgi:hypothetical protein